MCFSECFPVPCGGSGDNPRSVHSVWFSRCFSPCDGFGYNPCDQKGAVCGSLAGVSHPCDGFGYNQYCDQKRAVCVSLVSVSHHVVLVTTNIVIRSVQYVFLTMLFWLQPM
jgi:hypothetical protein